MKLSNALMCVKDQLTYTGLFAIHTLMSVSWYLIAFYAAKLLAWVRRDLEGIPALMIPGVFKAMEVFFVILGAVIAAVYFTDRAYFLLRKIMKDRSTTQQSTTQQSTSLSGGNANGV